MASVLAVVLFVSAFVYAQGAPRPQAPMPSLRPQVTAPPAAASTTAPTATAPPSPTAGAPPGAAAGAEPGAEGGESEEMLYAPHPPLAMAPAEDLAAAGGGAGGEQQQQQDVPSATGIQVGGYLYGFGGFDYLPPAIPRYRLQVTPSLGTTGGILFRGMPYEDIQYMVHVGVNAGSAASIAASTSSVFSGSAVGFANAGFNIYVEEASAQWGTETFNVKGGHMRVPFSLSHPGIITGRLFVGRPIQTQAFVLGSDDGIFATVSMKDQIIAGKAGVFNGTSLGLYSTRLSRSSPLFVASVLAQPLGVLPYGEVDAERGPFHIALGMGAMTTNGKYYDASGHNSVGLSDHRFVASVAASFKGAYAQVEAMRRLARDDYAGRPSSATAIYVQGSYFIPVTKSLGLSPVGRLGTMGLDDATTDDDPGNGDTSADDPDNSSRARKSTTLELGLAIYPQSDQAANLKILLEYQSERYIYENQTAYGGYLSFLLAF
jgi:hypothetical protein